MAIWTAEKGGFIPAGVIAQTDAALLKTDSGTGTRTAKPNAVPAEPRNEPFPPAPDTEPPETAAELSALIPGNDAPPNVSLATAGDSLANATATAGEALAPAPSKVYEPIPEDDSEVQRIGQDVKARNAELDARFGTGQAGQGKEVRASSLALPSSEAPPFPTEVPPPFEDSFASPTDGTETQDEKPAYLADTMRKADEERRKKTTWRFRPVADRLADFRRQIKESAARAYIKTGFRRLDEEVFGGGLSEGLYVISAEPSLGKTSFTLQIADNIARSGNPVLFFSVEMSEHELLAKSISRLTYEYTGKNHLHIAKTQRGIQDGRRYEYYSDEENSAINWAFERYKDFGDNIQIVEGELNGVSVYDIKRAIDVFIRETGKYPVVFVDYFQKLSKINPKGTDKQNADENITALKIISRDFHIPVIAVSSINRAAYENPDNLAAFKESGDIEYSADVLLAMKYISKGKTAKHADATTDQRGYTETFVGINVLKNRAGERGELKPGFRFLPAFNTFEELDSKEEARNDTVDYNSMLGRLVEVIRQEYPEGLPYRNFTRETDTKWKELRARIRGDSCRLSRQEAEALIEYGERYPDLGHGLLRIEKVKEEGKRGQGEQRVFVNPGKT